MSDPTYRVEYADGTSEDVPFAATPLIRIDFEEEHPTEHLLDWLTQFDMIQGRVVPWPPEKRKPWTAEQTLYWAMWKWQIERNGLDPSTTFREWLATIDAIVPIGKVAEAIKQASKELGIDGAEDDEDPLSEGGSPTASAEQAKSPVNPSET